MSSIPCFLCGKELEKRVSKKGKPYFVCDSCGVQLFVRRKQGIEKLEAVFKNAEKARIPYEIHARSFHYMQAILKEIDDVNGEMSKIGVSYFFDDEKLRLRNILIDRRETLFRQLEKFSQEKQ